MQYWVREAKDTDFHEGLQLTLIEFYGVANVNLSDREFIRYIHNPEETSDTLVFNKCYVVED